jgi:hypothetical protein
LGALPKPARALPASPQRGETANLGPVSTALEADEAPQSSIKEIEASVAALLRALEKAGVTREYLFQGKAAGTGGVGEAIVELRASIAKAHYKRTSKTSPRRSSGGRSRNTSQRGVEAPRHGAVQPTSRSQ